MSAIMIGSVTFDMNPSEDTGWFYEPVREITHIPGSNVDVIQSMGKHSAKRELSGMTKSSSVKSGIDALVGSSTTFKDRSGTTFSVWFDSLQPRERRDVTNLANGTFEYKITLIRLT